uniref:DUF2156 domain-containing protein n=1 Tax=Parastrongyloides trichosuri TaxID=131310 RepID=A0A0N4ZGX7_PARTI
MAPLSGLEDRRTAPVFARVGALVFEEGGAVYGFQGLRAYKAKFGPAWRSKFIAAPPSTPLPLALLAAGVHRRPAQHAAASGPAGRGPADQRRLAGAGGVEAIAPPSSRTPRRGGPQGDRPKLKKAALASRLSHFDNVDADQLARGADVGQLLALHRVDVQVVGAAVLADDHALVGLLAGADEHGAALFQVPQRIGRGFPVGVGDQHALTAGVDGAFVGLVVAEHAVQHARAAGVGQELALIADQRARGRHQADAGLARARRTHVLQLGLTGRQLFDDDAGELVVDVDHDVFDRLHALAGLVGLEHHARTADRDFEAFAAHAFDQNAQLQFAAAGDLEGVLLGSFGDADGDVGLGFLQQARSD